MVHPESEEAADGGARVDRRRFGFGLALISLAALGLRLYMLTTIARRNPDGGDPFYYHAQANFLVEGKGFSDPFTWRESHRLVASAIHPPLFTLWLAIPSALGLKGFFAHKVMSCLAGVLAVALIGVFAREVGGRRVGLIAAAIAAVYPPLWVIDGQLWPEGLFTAMLALSCWCGVKAWRNAGVGWPIGLGVSVALAALTRGEAIALAPLLIVPVLVWRPSLRWVMRWRDVAIAGAACLVVLAPWLIRNATTFERPVTISTNSDEVFVYANNPYAYGTKSDDAFLGFWFYPWQDELRARSGEPSGDASQKAHYWRVQGLDYARSHTSRLPVVLAARLGRQWNVYRPFQNARFDQIDGKNLRVSQSGVFAWWAVLALSVPGVVLLRRRRVTIIPFAALAATTSLTALYAYGADRFRTPIDMAAIVLAAVALGAAWDHWVRSPVPAPEPCPDQVPAEARSGGQR
jgi:4-amino-4-deoxy-L-arabinose transferase-like glycosyltransferase